MALQLRNTIFDPLVVGILTTLATIMTANGVKAVVKHVPQAGRGDPYVYEGVGSNFILRLEIPSAKATGAAITALDAAITGASATLLLEEDGWDAGSDADLRE